MIISKSQFEEPWWCCGAHAQTIAGALLRKKFKHGLKVERLETPDGDFLDLDYMTDPDAPVDHDTPLIVILHGLEGSSKSPYVQTLLSEIHRRRWAAVAVNMRMCSGEPNRLIQTYHSGKSEDLELIIQHLTKRYRPENLYLVGYSMGGNILLKWLGEQQDRASQRVNKAAAISVPYDLTRAVQMIDKEGFNREIYARNLLSTLKKKVAYKKNVFPEAIRYEKVAHCRTFSVFDREVTAPLNGFRDEFEYWSKSSSAGFLKEIKLSTLLIHSEDDPFFPEHFLPLDDIHTSNYLQALIVPKGGHLGFIKAAWPWKLEPWLEQNILNFFEK